MRNSDGWFESVVDVSCTDNGKTISADVIEFNEGKYMSVSLNTVRVSLQYNSKFNEYVGSMGGMEFIAKAPKRVG